MRGIDGRCPVLAMSGGTDVSHSGGDAFSDVAAKAVAQNILRFRRGEALPNVFDRKAGY